MKMACRAPRPEVDTGVTVGAHTDVLMCANTDVVIGPNTDVMCANTDVTNLDKDAKGPNTDIILRTNNDVDRCINTDVIFNNGYTFAREINAVVVMVTHANCVSSGAETRIHVDTRVTWEYKH